MDSKAVSPCRTVFEDRPLGVIIGEVLLERKIVSGDGSGVWLKLIKMVLRGKRRLTEAQDGVRQCNTVLFGGTRVLAGVENQVDLIVLQCLQLLKLRVKAVQVEMQGLIPQTIRRIYDIIREDTGNITGLDIKGADTGVMIQKTDADGAMLLEPVLLLG